MPSAILWTIRAATMLYVVALAQMLFNRNARTVWTAGCALYLAHVAAAFHYAYQWSHAVAVRETARQTEALFGLDWGGGVWFNYAFTAVWTADALWWQLAPESRRSRPAWVGTTIHAYMASMFFNAAIVFPTGAFRWIAAGLAVALLVAWHRSR